MLSLLQIIKLAKQIEKFVEVETNNGILIIDGNAEVGKAVFIEGDEGVVQAADGEYVSDDKVIVVVDGKIAEINDKPADEPENEPENEPEDNQPSDNQPENEPEDNQPENEPDDNQPDEKDAKIAELENRIKELEDENADLKSQLDTAKEEIAKPVKSDTKLAKDTQKSKIINYLNKK